MKRNKIVEIILSLMLKLKIKNKKIKYTVIATLGLLLAASTQLTMFNGDVKSIEPSKSVIEEVVREGAQEAASGLIKTILDNLF